MKSSIFRKYINENGCETHHFKEIQKISQNIKNYIVDYD